MNARPSPGNNRHTMKRSPRALAAAMVTLAAITPGRRAAAQPTAPLPEAAVPTPPLPPAPAPAPTPPAASFGEIQLSMALGGEGSSWAGDGAAFGGIRAGFRFKDLIAPYFMARMGYATVNQRVLELIELGVQIYARLGITRPYFRLGMLHQHEESWAAYEVDYLGSFLGVADGINHRDGGEFAVGLDIPVAQYKAWQFHLTLEALTTVFPPDQRGPRVYGGGTFGFGFNYGL